MPTYSWECDCGFTCEEIDIMTGAKVKQCPRCAHNTLTRLIGCGSGFSFGTGYKDKAGENIHFKEPYFDKALRRKFTSAKEKAEFMNANGIVSAGDSDIKVKREKKEHYEKTNDTKKGVKNGS